MKKKSWLTALIAVLAAFMCMFTVACGGNTDSDPSNPDTPDTPAPVTLTVSLDETSGAVSFSPAVDGAKNYEITVLRYQESPKTYTASASPYTVAPLEAGEIRITVRALGEENKELGAGSVTVTLTRNIGMPQSVTGVAISGDTLSWNAEETAVSYTLEAVKAGEVKATKSGLTELSYDLSGLELGAGRYEIRVSGVNEKGVKGTYGKANYLVAGESGFLTERAAGEYYIADFRKADAREFIENYGSTVKADSETLEYADAEWNSKGVWYTLPEAIDWNTVLQIKMRTRVTGTTSGGCYAYLFNENNVDQGIYPGQAWNGFGTESLRDDGDGWQITTFSAELIRRQTMNDSYWKDGEAEYLSHIFFGSSSTNANIEVDYVTYTVRTAADEFSLTYKGEELADTYRSVDKFDWSRLGITGNYDVDYRLEKDGSRVELETEQRLEAGNYKLVAKAHGKYYGKAEKEFVVEQSDLAIPSGITDLVYDDATATLSWTAAENAANYKIIAKKLDGTVIENTETTVSGTSASVTLPAGKINVIVTAVSSDGVEGRDILTQVVSLGNTGYMQPASLGSDQLVIASFDTTDYLGFMSSGGNGTFVIEDGNFKGVSERGSWDNAVAVYDLPAAIKDEGIYEIIARFKGRIVLQFINQNDEVVDAIIYGGAYYGITDITADGEYKIARFSFDSILKCASTVAGIQNDIHYKWTADKNEATKIKVIAVDAGEIVIDYIRLVKTVSVAEEDISIRYDGNEVASEYTIADDFDWTKFAVENYGAEFTLTMDGATVEKTTRLAEGDYTLTATLTGKYVGLKSINFRVNFVVIPEKATDLAFDKTAKTLTFTKAEGATNYEISALYTLSGKTASVVYGTPTVGTDGIVTVPITSVSGGHVTLYVVSVSDDEIRSTAATLDITTDGNLNYMQPASEGSDQLVVADFDSADYLGYLQGKGTANFEVSDGTLKFTRGEKETVAEYILPSEIDAGEVYKILVRVKASGIVDNKNGPNLVFYNQRGEAVIAYLWATGYYGVPKTLDGDWWNVEFSFRSIADCEGMKFDWCDVYKWTGTDNKVVKIGISAWNTKEQIIDYIRLVKIVSVAEENISIKYNGSEVAGEYTTAFDFDWTKFAVENYGAEFTLTKGGETVDQTARLAEGDYTLTATLTGKYVGSKSINFRVRAVVVPDQVTDLAFDATTKTLTFKKANNATSYDISAKTKAGDTLALEYTEATEGETVTVTITTDLPAGYVTFAVRSVSADSISSEAVETTVAILGNTSFGAPKAEGSMYTYIANFNHADYAAFVNNDRNAEDLSVTEQGLTFKATASWGSAVSVTLPEPISLEGRDYVIQIKMKISPAAIVMLYNEKGEGMYAYHDGKTGRDNSAALRLEKIEGAWDETYAVYVMTITKASVESSTNSACKWTNKQAKAITKIGFDSRVKDCNVIIYDIVVSDAPIGKNSECFTSGTTVTVGEEQGTTVFDVKEDANVTTYNEYSVKDGVLRYSMFDNWMQFDTYTLSDAVAITENSVIKLRVKGRVYVTLKDTSGKNVCNQIKWYGTYEDNWSDATRILTFEEEADSDFYIVTVAAAKITNKNAIKSIVVQGAEANQVGYIDYIAVVG